MQIFNNKLNDNILSQVEEGILNHQDKFDKNEEYSVFDDTMMTVNSVDGDSDNSKLTQYVMKNCTINKVYTPEYMLAFYFIPTQFLDVLSINDDITLLDERPVMTVKFSD